MARVELTEKADTDTEDIFVYLAERGGRPTVHKHQNQFEGIFDRLQLFLRSGHPRPKLGPNARVVIVLPYLIIYDWNEASDTVTILRILSGERKLTRKLLRG